MLLLPPTLIWSYADTWFFVLQNFLAYSYFCHKRCQINGFERYARFFKLLKSREKRAI